MNLVLCVWICFYILCYDEPFNTYLLDIISYFKHLPILIHSKFIIKSLCSSSVSKVESILLCLSLYQSLCNRLLVFRIGPLYHLSSLFIKTHFLSIYICAICNIQLSLYLFHIVLQLTVRKTLLLFMKYLKQHQQF